MTQEYLQEIFEYKDGELYWKKSTSKNKENYVGCIAGSITDEGYRLIKINGKIWLAHRLVFLFHKGYMPEMLDHMDRDKSNNKIDNLREVTYSQNNANRSRQKNNKSGFKGVWKRKDRGTYIVRVGIGKDRRYIGSYKTPEEAYEVYKQAAVETYGQFANV